MQLLRLAEQAADQNICWERLEAEIAVFAEPMSRTAQNPRYHGEGDVWTHTRLVCQTLLGLDSYKALSREARTTVFLAALFHDVGKIPTTRLEDGRWVSPHHASTGARMVREFLWQQELCGTQALQMLRETVCLLIRYHSVPPHIAEDPDGLRRLRAIAENGSVCPGFSLRLLCVLSEADALGRVAADRAEMAEQVQMCRELSVEAGCCEAPYPFPSAHTRFAYLSGRQVPPEIPLYDDTWGKVYMVSGLPGTGKDWWIAHRGPDVPVISLDEIRRQLHISPKDDQAKVAEEARERARCFLRRKESFLWNATNLTPVTRQKLVTMFADYGAAVEIIYLETGWQERQRRNKQRTAVVPEQVVCRMLGQLTPPEGKEAHTVRWITV